MNSYGQFTQYQYGNGLYTNKSYDCFGMLTEIKTGILQHLDYSFNPQTGNLIARKDKIHNLTELFEYDNLGRLISVNGPAGMNLTYSPNGNIASKTSVGTYTYNSQVKPHAVSSVSNPDTLISLLEQRISYTTANKVDTIVQGIYKYTIGYGQADQRTVTRNYQNNVLKETTWYDGAYEKDSTSTRVRQIHYISGGAGLAAIFVRTNNVDTMYYVHTDHLGSFDLITSSTGVVKDRYSFDACLPALSAAMAGGRRRNPLTWTYTSVPVNCLFNRGYTGHACPSEAQRRREHLDQFKLINMPARPQPSGGGNGRVYDPLLGRFLSPDKYVQGADFTQGYNRYSYVQNNPMNRVDPSGWKMVPFRGPWVNYSGEFIQSANFTMNFRPFLYDVTIGPESGLTTYGSDGRGLGYGGEWERGWNTTGLCDIGLQNYKQHLEDVENASKPYGLGDALLDIFYSMDKTSSLTLWYKDGKIIGFVYAGIITQNNSAWYPENDGYGKSYNPGGDEGPDEWQIKFSIGVQASLNFFDVRLFYVNMLGLDQNGFVFPGCEGGYTQMGSKISARIFSLHSAVISNTWEGRFNVDYCTDNRNEVLSRYCSFTIPNSTLPNGYPVVVQWGEKNGEKFFRYGQSFSISLIAGLEFSWWNYIHE